MIHAIYIYFIINAFIAGSANNWKLLIRDLLIGLPFYVFDIAFSWFSLLIWRLNSKYFFISFFRLWFTDRYKFFEVRMDYVRSRLVEGNWFERQFIRQLDKKYGYGITKGDQTP